MNFIKKHRVILIASLTALFLWSCHSYENFITYFNTYYNMERLMEKSEDEFEFMAYDDRQIKVYVPKPDLEEPKDHSLGPPPFMKEFIISQRQRQAVEVKLDSVVIKGSKILARHNKSDYVEGSLFLMAKSYFYRNEWRPSQVKCSELVDMFPNGEYSPDAHLLFAKNALIQRSFHTGKLMLSRTVDIAWQKKRYDILSEAFRLQAELALFEDDLEEALRPYRQAVAQSDDDDLAARWQLELAALLYRMSEFERAEKEFAKVRNFSPDYEGIFESYIYEASSMIRQEKFKEADEILTMLEDDSKFEEWQGYTFAVRLTALRVRGNEHEIKKGEKIADTAFVNNPLMTTYYFERGMDFYNEYEYMDAMQYFSKSRSQRTPVFHLANDMFKSLSDLQYKRRHGFSELENIKELEEKAKKEEEKSKDTQVVNVYSPMLESLVLKSDTSQDKETEKPSIAANDKTKIEIEEEKGKEKGNKEIEEPVYVNSPILESWVLKLPEEEKPEVVKKEKKEKKKGSKIDTSKYYAATSFFEVGRIHEELGNKDSSLYYYELSHETSPKSWDKSARFLHAYARKIREDDPYKSDSLYEVLADNYAMTEYGKDAMEKLGFTDEFIVDTTRELFTSGLKFKNFENYEFAIEQFYKVYDKFPEDSLAPRSLYNIGWIYESNLKDIDSTIKYYDLLIDEYPRSEYARSVMLPLANLKNAKYGTEIPDSLQYEPLYAREEIQRNPNRFRPELLHQEQERSINKKLSPKEIMKDPDQLLEKGKESISKPIDEIKNIDLDKINPLKLFESEEEDEKKEEKERNEEDIRNEEMNNFEKIPADTTKKN